MRGVGATSWRMPCPCRDALGIDDPSMHLEVSQRNLAYFVSEGRVPTDVTEDDLERWVEQAAATDRSLIVCNFCRRLCLVGGGDREELAGPEPRGGGLE